MPVPSLVETAIIGAGQCGLGASHLLTQAGREHVVLEARPSLGGGWQDRWDSFCLVTPNWTTALPGFAYDGADPDGFMVRDEIRARLTRYASVIGAPVILECPVARATLRPGPSGFQLETAQGTLRADHLIVATGSYHRPTRPPIADALPARLTQLHSHDYTNEAALPPGGVLVVGSGQSGIQLAEELLDAGRETYLAMGSAGWAPRRYRGRDLFSWLAALVTDGPRFGVTLPTVDRLPDPRARLAANPQLTGHGGGHDVDLRALASRGLGLLGRLGAVDGEQLTLAPGLGEALARADGFFDQRLRPPIDGYIAAAGIDAPDEPVVRSSFVPPERPVIDLTTTGIRTVIWTTGYRPDFGWLDLPIFDEQGLPRHSRGLSEVPGLGFLGLVWQYNQASATLFGPTQDGPPLLARMGLVPAEAVQPSVPNLS
ncbi:MAG TPA: NAD(P)-binding domain-containing protein [Candidatus Limnocylindrales bacterium]|nr:NAD(P)-binding domain-containing protein [Candidatus Limnocylindrales bacterium]